MYPSQPPHSGVSGNIPMSDRERLRQEIGVALRQRAAIHLYGPPGSGKGFFAQQLAQTPAAERAVSSRRRLCLTIWRPSLAAFLCRIARAFPSDPRAQAALKSGQPKDHLASLARCLREKQPLLVLRGDFDHAAIRPLLREIVGALPLLYLGERPIGTDWPGQEYALPPMSPMETRALLERESGSESSATLTPFLEKLAEEALTVKIFARAVRAGLYSLAEGAALLNENSNSEPLLSAIISRYTPATQGLLLLLAWGAPSGETLTSLVASTGATTTDLAEPLAGLRALADLQEKQEGDEKRFLLPIALRRRAQNWTKQAGTAAELRARAQEGWRARLSAALSSGATGWSDLPTLLETLEPNAKNTDWNLCDLQPLWEKNSQELAARGYAHELRLLRQAVQTQDDTATMTDIPDSAAPVIVEQAGDLREETATLLASLSAEGNDDAAEDHPDSEEENSAAPDIAAKPLGLGDPERETIPATAKTPMQLRDRGSGELERGETAAAIKTLTEALRLAKGRGAAALRADIQYQLGCAHIEDGALEKALTPLRAAAMTFEALGDTRALADALGAQGNVLGEMGRWKAAAAAHSAAVSAAHAAGDPAEEALQLSALAYAYRRSNQLAKALRSYRQALHLAYQTEDASNIAQTAIELASLLLQSLYHLDIAAIVLEAALAAGAPERDLAELRASLEEARQLAAANGIRQAAVHGDARAYALQAYSGEGNPYKRTESPPQPSSGSQKPNSLPRSGSLSSQTAPPPRSATART